MANRSRPVVLSDVDREALERLQRSPSARAGLTRRARVVLLMAQEVSGADIARQTGYTTVQVSRIRRRFAEAGIAGLADQPRSGRPPTVTARKTARIVALTLKPPAPGPAGAPHPRLPPQWSDEPLCRFQRGVGAGARRVSRSTHRRGVSRLPDRGASPVPPTGPARDSRQFVDAFDAHDPSMARSAPTGAVPFHADRCLVAQPGGSLVQHPDTEIGPSRIVRHRTGARHSHSSLYRHVE